jgi:hypothetical protein
MVKRKGIGYMIEVMASLLVVFTFILGNIPADPGTDWSDFQTEIIGEDITYVLEETGDTESFIRGGETGSLVTASETLSRDRVSVSGSVENVPISTQIVGFHTREIDRLNASLTPVSSGDQCHDDLEELEDSDAEILRSENTRAGAHIYVTDSDPGVSSGTNGEEDYDTTWVDNSTQCQFSSSEGPYYMDDFFYWGDGSGGDYWDINEIYGDGPIELFNSTQIIDLRGTLKQGVNGIDTGIDVDAVAVDREDLDSYNILVFRERETIEPNGVLETHKEKVQDYLSEGSVFLMMDLQKQDFYSGGTSADNFISETGLKWIDLPYRRDYRENPGDEVGGEFGSNSDSERVETFLKGVNGQTRGLNLTPGGNIASSNTRDFKRSEPLLYTDRGSYQTTVWNSTNYSMEEVDPANIDGYPETACVEEGTVDGNLTRGNFSFHNYENDDEVEYRAISTKLGQNDKFCRENDVRALNVDFNRNGDFDDPGEGSFLNGESLTVKNKRYTAYFPGEEAIENGTAAEFVYTGDSGIENINFRTSFDGFSGNRLARLTYKENYNEDEKKIISAVIHWLSDDTKEFGENEESSISTETVGGVKENTFIPYKISMRWR